MDDYIVIIKLIVRSRVKKKQRITQIPNSEGKFNKGMAFKIKHFSLAKPPIFVTVVYGSVVLATLTDTIGHGD